jgi:hypothetical protein
VISLLHKEKEKEKEKAFCKVFFLLLLKKKKKKKKGKEKRIEISETVTNPLEGLCLCFHFSRSRGFTQFKTGWPAAMSLIRC